MSGPAADSGEAGNSLGSAETGNNLGNADSGNSGSETGLGNTAGTDYEKLAREKGWRPKEEFEGDSESWVGAEEFVKRQPLYDKLKGQSKKLKELEKTVDAMAKHYKITIAQAREKAIYELKAERREAIELGEVAKVEDIDKSIEELKNTPDPLPVVDGPKPEITQFVEENKTWFNVDKAMTRFAVSFNEAYLAENPGELEESLKETLKAVKKAFPEKFENKRRETPPSVETGGAPLGGGSKYTMNRLTGEQKLVYNQLVKEHKQMSHDEYFKQLEEAGYLEG